MTPLFTLTPLVTFTSTASCASAVGLVGIGVCLVALAILFFPTSWERQQMRRSGAAKAKRANHRASRSWDRDGLGRRQPPKTPLGDIHDFWDAIFIH